MTPYERKKIKERASANREKTLQDMNMLIQSLEMNKIFPFTGGFLGELLRQHISFLTGQILYNIKRDHKFSCQEDFFKFFQGRLFRYVECLEDTIRAQIEIAIE